jgi:hypothetical protein
LFIRNIIADLKKSDYKGNVEVGKDL